MKNTYPETFIKAPKKLDCFITTSEELIKEAQVLRYRVFAQEMGADLKTKSEGLDYDDVDSYCEHLIVYDNCNKKKGNRTPKQANMELQNIPEKPNKNPKYLPISMHIAKIKEQPEEWKLYLPETCILLCQYTHTNA